MLLKNVNTNEVAELSEQEAIEQIRDAAESVDCPNCDGEIKSVEFATIESGKFNVECSNGHRFMVTPFEYV